MDKEISSKVSEAIGKTGYILENEVVSILEKEKWNTISNRYYIDDVTQDPREIDILGYKVATYEETQIYTVLLISCKSNRSNGWVFLTRDVKNQDPNLEPFPFEYWSNSKILGKVDASTKYRKEIEEASDHDLLKTIYGFKKNVFAFQEVNVKNGSPQNDKKIYTSIVSTIKAMEYEKDSLDDRKKTDAVYNFHLLTVYDLDSYEMDFSNRKAVKEIDNCKYVNRFIVNNNDSFHMIHFMNIEKFRKEISLFNDLHKRNKGIFISAIDQFIEQYPDSYSYQTVSFEEIKAQIYRLVRWEFIWESYNIADGSFVIKAGEDGKSLVVAISLSDDKIEKLNNDEKFLSKVSEVFKKEVRYKGNVKLKVFEAEDDIPF